MRVLAITHVYPSERAPAEGIFVHRHLSGIIAEGIDVEVVKLVPWFFRRYRQDEKTQYSWEGISVHPIQYLRIPSNRFYSLNSLFLVLTRALRILRIAQGMKADLIYSQWVLPSGPLGARVADKLQVPHAVSVRGSDINVYATIDPLARRLVRRVLNGAKNIFCVSQALAERVAEFVTSDVKPVLNYNGCDFESFNPVARAVQERAFTFIYVGNLKLTKGVMELLVAFEKVSSHSLAARLLVVGDGPCREMLESYAKERSLKVKFYGEVAHEHVPDILREADCFVLPSYAEGMPNALVEAMASGLPVIASRVGGIPEIVKDGETGLLLEEVSPHAIQSCMEQVLEWPMEKRLSAGYGANEIVRQHFSWKNNARTFVRAVAGAGH